LDVPDFYPNEHYVRELKRFGVLPPNVEPGQPVDPYAADQAYWRLFWHRPGER
jgi:hypothetical protein